MQRKFSSGPARYLGGFLLSLVVGGGIAGAASERPNVLLILIDDHAAHMTSVLAESIVRTPNIERLAARGTWFPHAYNAVPTCAASRTAFLTGVQSSKSGVHYNRQAYRRSAAPIARATSLPRHFLEHGYLVAGFGKIFHTGYQLDNVADFTPGYFKGHRLKEFVRRRDSDLVQHIIPGTLRLPNPAYRPTLFGALPDDWDRDDPEKMQQDTEQAMRVVEFLRADHDKPFFLACGFWRPHSERIVPQRYFDLYPIESVEIPRSFRAGDLDDVPAAGRWAATHLNTHAHVVNSGMLREYLRSYYAAVSYVDDMIGRVLDALEASRYDRNTIIIFASDNGYNAGEKDMWAKFALWDQTCRVVFAMAVPGQAPRVARTPVSLLDIYPTLVAICGLPAPGPQELDGIDLSRVIRGKSDARGAPVLSTYGVGNHSIRNDRFRYIRYRTGDEELYDLETDPHEWRNLAPDPQFAGVKASLRALLPSHDAPEIESALPHDGSELDDETYRRIDEYEKSRHSPPPARKQ